MVNRMFSPSNAAVFEGVMATGSRGQETRCLVKVSEKSLMGEAALGCVVLRAPAIGKRGVRRFACAGEEEGSVLALVAIL